MFLKLKNVYVFNKQPRKMPSTISRETLPGVETTKTRKKGEKGQKKRKADELDENVDVDVDVDDGDGDATAAAARTLALLAKKGQKPATKGPEKTPSQTKKKNNDRRIREKPTTPLQALTAAHVPHAVQIPDQVFEPPRQAPVVQVQVQPIPQPTPPREEENAQANKASADLAEILATMKKLEGR